MSGSLSRIDATTESPRNRWEPDSSPSRFQQTEINLDSMVEISMVEQLVGEKFPR